MVTKKNSKSRRSKTTKKKTAKKKSNTKKKTVTKKTISKKEKVELPRNAPEEFSKPHKLMLVLSFSFLAFVFSLITYLFVSKILYLNLFFVFVFSMLASRILAKQKKKSAICCSCSGCLIGVVSSVLVIFVISVLFLFNILVQDIILYLASSLLIGGISCFLGSKI
ncbi:hypothetical protein KO317_00270 [Candidatus Micrarchaeota archaeon]|jgi:Fe2+ transport system protein B|nr:hypothetical protein [Candidatus Micrarchaeota archaeon]